MLRECSSLSLKSLCSNCSSSRLAEGTQKHRTGQEWKGVGWTSEAVKSKELLIPELSWPVLSKLTVPEHDLSPCQDRTSRPGPRGLPGAPAAAIRPCCDGITLVVVAFCPTCGSCVCQPVPGTWKGEGNTGTWTL